MTDYQGILICGEVIEQKITTVTSELINTRRRLNDELKEPLGLLLIGQNIQEAAHEAISLCSDRVYVVNESSFRIRLLLYCRIS